jgi:predicted metal-binding membrane protein
VTEPSALESLLKRDRAIELAGLIGVTALAWIYLFVMAAALSSWVWSTAPSTSAA